MGVDPLSIGLGVGSLALGAFQRPRHDSAQRARAINARYGGTPETGYLTDADYAQAERLRKRGGEAAGAFGAQAEAGVRRRSAQRGLYGPAQERDIARVRSQEGDIISEAGTQAESNLYDTATRNRMTA